jgi:glycosyltransferase involved in cell wall biosynthesis
MFIVHGPAGSTTGLGYTTEYFAHGIDQLGIAVATAADSAPEWWRAEGYHLVINQPMMLKQDVPWHGFVPFFEFTPRPDEVPKLTLTWPKRTMFCSNPWMKETVRDLQPDNTLRNRVFDFQLGATVERFSHKERQPGTVVHVGKAEPRKGTGILLEALKSMGRTATLGITHPLHMEWDHEQITRGLRGVDHTLVPFSQSHEEVRALFDVSHIAVFPSTAEGWNMGLTEAVAAGCIVVASDISAHRYQYELLKQSLGDEVDARLMLVPTSEVPMEFHPRWYPMHHYAGQKWMAPSVEDLADTIEKALDKQFPGTPDPTTFPLSWERAAHRFIETVLVDRVERRPGQDYESVGSALGIPGDLTNSIAAGRASQKNERGRHHTGA